MRRGAEAREGEDVVAAAADQHVAPGEPGQPVVAAAADQPVAAAVAGQPVVAGAAGRVLDQRPPVALVLQRVEDAAAGMAAVRPAAEVGELVAVEDRMLARPQVER